MNSSTAKAVIILSYPTCIHACSAEQVKHDTLTAWWWVLFAPLVNTGWWLRGPNAVPIHHKGTHIHSIQKCIRSAHPMPTGGTETSQQPRTQEYCISIAEHCACLVMHTCVFSQVSISFCSVLSKTLLTALKKIITWNLSQSNFCCPLLLMQCLFYREITAFFTSAVLVL